MSDPAIRLNVALKGRYRVERELGEVRILLKDRSFTLVTILTLAACIGCSEPVRVQELEAKHHRVADYDAYGSVSPDGQFVSSLDWTAGANIVVRDLRTGEKRQLTDSGWDSEGRAWLSTISPDAKHVAYGWTSWQRDWAELRIVGLDGSPPRVLYRDETIQWVDPHGWSPDGSQILTMLSTGGTGQIALVSVVDGSVRVLKSVDRLGSPRTMSFSPDGQYIAYDHPVQEGSAQRDIFVMSADGSRETSVVRHPSDDRLFGWSPDGTRILLASDRSGTWDAWAVPVRDGAAHGEAERIQQDIGWVSWILGVTPDGDVYYGVSDWINDVYVTSLDPQTGKLGSPDKIVSHVGWNTSVEWSPDGEALVYARGVGVDEVYSLVLGIRSLATGEERLFPLELSRFGGHTFEPHWAPDGRAVLAQGRDPEGRQGIYRIDAGTGHVTPILAGTATNSNVGSTSVEWPAWSRDGRLIVARWIEGGPQIIVVRELDTGRERELVRYAEAMVSHLTVSPDGRQVAFVSTDRWDSENPGTTRLRVIPTSGGEARELLELPPPPPQMSVGPVGLAWTPDSRHLIYATSRTGAEPQMELWRIATDGGQPESLGLVMEGLAPYGLSVHPDGERIAFTAGTEIRSELWVLELPVPAAGGVSPPN